MNVFENVAFGLRIAVEKKSGKEAPGFVAGRAERI